MNIRNLSASGVLIEAAVLPPTGARVVLKRGSLEAAGTIAWRGGRRAGLAFEAAIQVADWMSRKPGHHQERVDQILHSVKAERRSTPEITAIPFAAPTTRSIESELLLLLEDLDRLGNGLSEDPTVIGAHPEIQLLDLSVQRIGRILSGLGRAA